MGGVGLFMMVMMMMLWVRERWRVGNRFFVVAIDLESKPPSFEQRQSPATYREQTEEGSTRSARER